MAVLFDRDLGSVGPQIGVWHANYVAQRLTPVTVAFSSPRTARLTFGPAAMPITIDFEPPPYTVVSTQGSRVKTFMGLPVA